MRDRLIELMYKTNEVFANVDCTDEEAMVLLADYLLENGVIVPPCKVGETVWINTKFGTLKARVIEITQNIDNKFLMHIVYDLMYCYKQHINTHGYVGYVDDKFEFGKTAYHTKEEAEQALGKLQASYKQVKGGEE